LAYATCSVFSDENENVVADFMEQQPKATLIKKHQFLPFDGGDGFFIARLRVA
jgi:16S rRNA (cytosine967-C5)-methyltransferase